MYSTILYYLHAESNYFQFKLQPNSSPLHPTIPYCTRIYFFLSNSRLYIKKKKVYIHGVEIFE